MGHSVVLAFIQAPTVVGNCPTAVAEGRYVGRSIEAEPPVRS